MINRIFLQDIAHAFEDHSMQWFIHKPTLEVIFLPQDEFNDNEWITPNREKIEENYGDYILIEPFESRVMFSKMAEFVEQVDDAVLKKQLMITLSGHKPFANFKNVLNYYPDHRQQWFDFRDKFLKNEVIEWLKDHDLYEAAMKKGEEEP